MPKNTINNKSDPLEVTTLTINSGTYTFPTADGDDGDVFTTDGAGTVTLSPPPAGGLTWSEISSDTFAAVNNGYTCNSASLITITLPSTFVAGDEIKIAGKGTGGWAVKANTGDTIYMLNQTELAPDPFIIVNSRGTCTLNAITDNSEWEITQKEDEFLSGDVTAIACGINCVNSLKTSGNVKGWGANANGQLGNGTITSTSYPLYAIGNHVFTAISSTYHTLALKADGSVWSWGRNDVGQLGDETVIYKSSPVSVVGGHSFTKISCSLAVASYGLKADGSVWSWGANAYGALGDNSVVNKSSPVAVTGGHSFTDIKTGSNEVIALKADGSVWTWGRNSWGQLGDNSVVNKSSPVAVTGGHSFIHITFGNGSAACLKADGSCWTWGNNDSGQLGDGTIIRTSSPIAVTGGHSFIDVVGGSNEKIALKADGSVWTWGLNTSGQLGDETVVNKSSPVSVVGGHSFTVIGCSNAIMAALKADGSCWTWGFNTSGQLGDGTLVSKSSPIQVLNL